MTRSAILRLRHAAACASIVAIAGCGAGATSMSPFVTPPGLARVAGHLATGHSWMLPEAKNEDLLYVSDLEAQAVYVYDYRGKANKLVGTITGFFNPEGLCVDKKGDVWVTNDSSVGDHQVFEYAHGATSPMQTFEDPDGRVNGCAVDPVTGNLAVTNFWGATEGVGGVSIYVGAKNGTPESYSSDNIYYYYYCGYDDSGNLYVDGLSYGSNFGFAELPEGGSSFDDITLDQEIYLPGGVQWDGKYLAVGDQVAVKHNFNSVIYQFSLSGSTGTEVNYIEPPDANEVAQFWLPRVGIGGKKNGEATRVIGPNGGGHDTLIWAYPNPGSNPLRTISGENDPIGATVSFARR
ncbi:MAG TPA: hypothetical protein VGX91_03070 [Candidatus Cybelea sp.]|jgi:hypothetical protein|nr:hypothetical protein [Candidatus Cybelea sp.]